MDTFKFEFEFEIGSVGIGSGLDLNWVVEKGYLLLGKVDGGR